jgi:glycosyltransferase involved in cell wall biosynthesis
MATDSRTIVFFMAKPSFMSFGGNDTFLLELIEKWPSKTDRLICTFNRSHPCRDLFQSKLSARAQIEILDEPLVQEMREALAHQGGRFGSEFIQDMMRPVQSARAIKRLYHRIRSWNADIVFLNVGGNPPEDLGWRFMLASWLAHVPRIIYVTHIYPGHATNWLRGLALAILRRCPPLFCDIIVAPSNDCAQVTVQSMHTARLPVCIYYGIDRDPPYRESVEEKRALLKLRPGPVIGAIANVEARKGMHYLIQAMSVIHREFPDAQLRMIGKFVDPAHVEQLNKEISELGLSDVARLTGPLPDAARFCECFDILAAPSIQNESFGIVAIEAMRYAKPVVASTNGGLPEVVADQDNGLIVPMRDSTALAEALLKLLRSPALRSQMGQRGRERFLEKFTVDIMARQYFDLTRRALRCGRGFGMIRQGVLQR